MQPFLDYTQTMFIDKIICDLDDTIYPADSGVWDAIGDRINEFILQHLPLRPEEVIPLRDEYFHQYGTTLRGLQIRYQINPHEYLAFVHDIPLEDYLLPIPELHSALQTIPLPKVIFTNSDRNHAKRVLDHLGVADCFEEIIDVLDLSPYCKPMPESFDILISKVGSPPQRLMLLEDSIRNLNAAQDMGFVTVQVGGQNRNNRHPYIASILDLPTLFTPDFSLQLEQAT